MDFQHYLVKLKPFLDFNRKGQLLIIIAITLLLLIARGVIMFFEDYYAVLGLNLAAFALIFFWISRIAIMEVRSDDKRPMTGPEKMKFILVSSCSLLIVSFALMVRDFFITPVLMICLGFFLILWLAFIFMDKFVMQDTYIRYYFKYLFIIVLCISVVNISFYFLTRQFI